MARAPTTHQTIIDFKRFAALAKGNLKDAALETAQDITLRVVETSPVLTGFLRASWFVTIGEPGPVRAGTGAAGGSFPMPVISVTGLDYTLGQTLFIQNSTIYAARLEFGFVDQDSLGRTYNQAGRGWVRNVVDQAPAIAYEAAARVAARNGGG